MGIGRATTLEVTCGEPDSSEELLSAELLGVLNSGSVALRIDESIGQTSPRYPQAMGLAC